MSDTFDAYQTSPSSIPPLTKAILDGMPHNGGTTYGPCLSDTAFRSLLDALAALEQKQISHGW